MTTEKEHTGMIRTLGTFIQRSKEQSGFIMISTHALTVILQHYQDALKTDDLRREIEEKDAEIEFVRIEKRALAKLVKESDRAFGEKDDEADQYHIWWKEEQDKTEKLFAVLEKCRDVGERDIIQIVDKALKELR